MSEATIKPTIEKLESLFTTFNKRFYNGELEKAVITVSPDEGRNAYGWCTTYKAWKNQQDSEKGYYEINICAEHLSRNFNELCSTLLHEMVHLWNLQTEIQDTSRGGSYHNKKFKEVAEQHGLHIEQVPKYGWTKTTLNEEGERFIEQMKDKNFDIYIGIQLQG